MDKNKHGMSLEDDKLPASASDSIALKSTLTPPTQPLPKDQTKSGTNVNIKG